jgi:hypothetical protein
MCPPSVVVYFLCKKERKRTMPQNMSLLKELSLRAPSNLSEALSPDRYFMMAANIGGRAFGLATTKFGIYIPKPGTHISDRLQAQMPANRARIGAQYVSIAAQLKREVIAKRQAAEGSRHPNQALEEAEELRKSAAAMTVVGHGTISRAILAAETEPLVPDSITLKTVNIAKRAHTHPELLIPTGWLSEFDAARAEQLMVAVPARVM